MLLCYNISVLNEREEIMKELSKMTRKELATLVVESQIKRGIVKAEKKNYLVKRILTDNLGTYASKEYLIKVLEG